MKLRAIHVPADIDAAYTTDEGAFLHKYLLIMTNTALDNRTVSQREFAKEQDDLTANFGDIPWVKKIC